MITLNGEICTFPASQSEEECKKIELKIDKEPLFQADLAQTWSLGFSSVLFFYFLSLVVGRILEMIKKA